jgi:hypothetical protein
MTTDTLNPPTAEERADFEAFLTLFELSAHLEATRRDRISSHAAAEHLAGFEGSMVTDVGSLAAAIRPSGVKPRPMRFPGSGAAGTLRGYSKDEVWRGIERIFRRHFGEPSGLAPPQPQPGVRDIEASSAMYKEFFDRCPLADAWRHFWTIEGGELDYTEPFPSTPEEYRSKRFGILYADEDQRRPPANDEEESRVRHELRVLARVR